MNAVFPTKKDANRSLKRLGCLLSILLAFILLLGVVSLSTSFYRWDGAFPGGEFYIHVQNHLGEPVTGAILNIYQKNRTTPSFGYPFDNYVSGQSLISDSTGEIVVLHIPRGIEFGGGGSYLFWVIPIGESYVPDFRCEISADGYKLRIFPVSLIFNVSDENVHPIPTQVVEYKGTAYTLSGYDRIIVVDNK